MIAAATGALVVTAVVLILALVTAASTRASGRELSQRLVPAAADATSLLKDYTNAQSSLRDYVTSGQAAQLSTYQQATARAPVVQRHLAGLIHGYPAMPAQLAAGVAAQQAWIRNVAAPQLTAASRGNFRLARLLQADIPAPGHTHSPCAMS